MAVLAIVPARGGSKRLPGKNLQPLGGKPLVAWVIEAAMGARTLDRIVVSSDHPEVLELARRYDPAFPLERPAALSGDRSPAIDFVRHALQSLEVDSSEGSFDVVVILQPSSPFTLAEDIDATVSLLRRTGADSAVTVVELDHAIHPAKLKIMRGDALLPYLEEEGGRMAAHELPRVYVRNCAVYATQRRVVDEGVIIGADCRGLVMPRERSLDINEAIDLEFARFMLERAGRSAPPPVSRRV